MDNKVYSEKHNYFFLTVIRESNLRTRYQMQLLSRSFADIVLREREETKRGGKGMAEGGGDRQGGTEMMDGVSESEP